VLVLFQTGKLLSKLFMELPFQEIVQSVILCPCGGNSYFKTNDVCLGKEKSFPSKMII
jgi:hypothetical protein